ncbi:MAG: hypothetical protein JJ896_14520 [Rhodothermales bacterium]|nr:hypothetical protein [Rhodothermales bacterium]MBO6780865.1 hypothetical protein [Rhodothermales bacterium]
MSLLLLVVSGCAYAPDAAEEPSLSGLDARVEAIRSLKQLEFDDAEGFSEAQQTIEAFRFGIMQAGTPDTGGTNELTRQRNRLLYRHALTKEFLDRASGSKYYHVIRTAVAEEMLRLAWMSRSANVDSIELYYVRHAVEGFGPDLDRVTQALLRLDVASTAKQEIAREALLNLRAYEIILQEWIDRNPASADRVVLSYGEGVTAAGYLARVEDNAASLQLYLVEN